MAAVRACQSEIELNNGRYDYRNGGAEIFGVKSAAQTNCYNSNGKTGLGPGVIPGVNVKRRW